MFEGFSTTSEKLVSECSPDHRYVSKVHHRIITLIQNFRIFFHFTVSYFCLESFLLFPFFARTARRCFLLYCIPFCSESFYRTPFCLENCILYPFFARAARRTILFADFFSAEDIHSRKNCPPGCDQV